MNLLLFGLAGALALGAALPSLAAPSLSQERINLLAQKEPSLPSLQPALRSPDPILRRTAVRLLGKQGEAAIPSLQNVLQQDHDPLARRIALQWLCRLPGGHNPLPWLEIAGADQDELVRAAAMEEAAALQPRTEALSAFLRQGQSDDSPMVSQLALRSLWTYTEEVRSARLQPEFHDHQMELVQRISFSTTDWKFRRDPRQTGHLEDWMNPAVDEKEWVAIGIAKSWQDFGIQYQGVGWYRHHFTLPQRPDYQAADLVFEAVDESAWVWLNGTFLGGHDIGVHGYNLPFATDARDQLRWGEENVLVVRVYKRHGSHAGIWKPVHLDLLKKHP